jgi:hypothetical protein
MIELGIGTFLLCKIAASVIALAVVMTFLES